MKAGTFWIHFGKQSIFSMLSEGPELTLTPEQPVLPSKVFKKGTPPEFWGCWVRFWRCYNWNNAGPPRFCSENIGFLFLESGRCSCEHFPWNRSELVHCHDPSSNVGAAAQVLILILAWCEICKKCIEISMFFWQISHLARTNIKTYTMDPVFHTGLWYTSELVQFQGEFPAIFFSISETRYSLNLDIVPKLIFDVRCLEVARIICERSRWNRSGSVLCPDPSWNVESAAQALILFLAMCLRCKISVEKSMIFWQRLHIARINIKT